MRVALDITKPLSRALKIRTVLGDEQLISFTYEHLPNFCYLCGCLGHLSRQCELQLQPDFKDPGLNTPFGGWLQAAAPAFTRRRTGGSSSQNTPCHFLRPTFVTPSSLQSKSLHPPGHHGAAIFDPPPLLPSLLTPPTVPTPYTFQAQVAPTDSVPPLSSPQPTPTGTTGKSQPKQLQSRKRQLTNEWVDDEDGSQGPRKASKLSVPLLR
ncbi:UNVERIFIED_CONTAM: hypothetical protein Sradi_2029200 [Sesamum radiatum]|uniref:CCHC-type domain-containing protein n=1 Tax=Sesamum radiatum TaxID=300843 RepID=A0AAW2TGX4_SESRA